MSSPDAADYDEYMKIMNDPIENPDGTLCCPRHYLEVCGICCVDYTYMRDHLEGGAVDSDDSSGIIEVDEELGVQSSKRNRCIICREPATKRCSRCKDVNYCNAKHQELDREAHKKQCAKLKAAGTSKRGLMLLVIGGMHELISSFHDDFFAMIEDKLTISHIFTMENAIRILTSTTRPAYVIVADLIRAKQHSALLDALVQFAKKGGTVICGLEFSSFCRPPDINEIFARFGLSWKSGPWERVQFVLHPDETTTKGGAPRRQGDSNRKKVRDKTPKEELLERGVNPLPYTYDMNALRLKDVPADQAIYLQHGVEPSSRDELLEAGVAFAPVGKGWVGYIGDINKEAMSEVAMRAMLGLRIHATETSIPSPVSAEERRFMY